MKKAINSLDYETASEAGDQLAGFEMETEIVYREKGRAVFDPNNHSGPRTIGEMIDRQLDSLAFGDGDMRDIHLSFSPDDWARIRYMYKGLDMFNTAS